MTKPLHMHDLFKQGYKPRLKGGVYYACRTWSGNDYYEITKEQWAELIAFRKGDKPHIFKQAIKYHNLGNVTVLDTILGYFMITKTGDQLSIPRDVYRIMVQLEEQSGLHIQKSVNITPESL